MFALLSCHQTEYTRLFHTEEKATELEWEALADLQHLGPTVYERGVNFSVFSARAERIELLLFDDPESDRPTQQFEMVPFEEVWNLYVEGVGPGQHYGFVVWGPNWPYVETFYPGSLEGFRADVDERGNRFNPNKLMFDPYGKALHRDHDWARGSAASGPFRQETSYGAAAKSVIVESTYEWGDSEWRALRESDDHPGHGPADAIVYEVHLKGISANAASNQFGVEHPGTYQGLGEMAGYLSDLGITSVELLPVHEKPSDGGYWGYNNSSFFALENTYSAAFLENRQPVETIDEFKAMVDALHAEDIEVIVDVVYNHTGEGGLWRTKLFYDDPDGDFLCDPASFVPLDSAEMTTMLSLRGLDNASYYELSNANQAYWQGSTGVGNQVRANHRPARRLILDSLRYLVEELHVDGFRFDLAGVLGEADGERSQYWTSAESADTVLAEIIDDPVLQRYNTRIIAEPWTTAYDGSTQYPNSADKAGYGWSEWNANFRDWWRAYLNNKDDDGYFAMNDRQGIDGGAALTGSFERYSHNGRKPYHAVNFLTAHDGFTLADLFSFENKENGCGPLNPICCEDACSPWCDPNSGDDNNHSASWSDEPAKRGAIRNAFVGLFISQGTPMMLGGDEWMRTQYGNNNSYSTWADNEWNWFRWGEWTSQNNNNVYRHRMHDFVRQMIRFRKEHSYAFAPEEWDGGMPIAWKNELNQDADGATWGSRHMMVHYHDDGGAWEEPEILVLMNMESGPVDFTLPGGRDWGVVIDTQPYFDLPGRGGEPTGWFDENPEANQTVSRNATLDNPLAVSGVYQVPPNTIVILEEQ